MYWLLVMRSDLDAVPGDVDTVKGRTIGAAPLVDQGLKRLLIDAGLDLERDGVRIVGVVVSENSIRPDSRSRVDQNGRATSASGFAEAPKSLMWQCLIVILARASIRAAT
jgi:hypothetical protein